jgi:hypothetical protein
MCVTKLSSHVSILGRTVMGFAGGVGHLLRGRGGEEYNSAEYRILKKYPPLLIS